MPKVGFGLERLGLVACRWPWATIAVHVLVTLFCAVGFARIEIDSQLGEMFRSDTADYQVYKNMKRKFPASGSDILVVLEGDKLLARETIERLRDLHLELQFVDGADAVLSMFSVRRPPDADGFPAPLFPDELPEGEAFAQVIADVRAHPLTKGKFLSADGKLGLMILALKRTVMETAFAPAIAATRLAVDEALAGTGVTASLTGVPVMRDEIAQAIRHDRITYNLGGFLVGCLVSFLFFRNLAVVAIGSAAPGAAVLWSFGAFGWLGQELNVMIVVVAPLVMVIAFSDAMHMLFGIRRGLDDGLTIEGAVKRAVSTIGPACVLTSMTTALALSSLWFAESEAIQNFGIHAAGAAGIAFLSVITLVPALSIILLGKVTRWRPRKDQSPPMIGWLYKTSERLARVTMRWALPIAASGIVLLGLASAAHISLKPRYSLSDYLPDGQEAGHGISTLDRVLKGSQALHLMITWPEGQTLADEKVQDAVADGHAALAAGPDVFNVWSLQSLRSWLEQAGAGSRERIASYVGELPPFLKQRLVSEDNRSALITGRIANVASEEGRQIIAAIEPSIDRLREAYPEFQFSVTGLTTVFARHTSPMIRSLENSIFIAVCMVLLLIAFAFRSIQPALLSILPNLLPIMSAGALLYLANQGLQLASGIAMTVAFGLAVDDTIHFLYRYRLERRRGKTVDQAVADTIRMIGAVLIMTTIVLVLGVAVTLLSAVPANRLFGQLAAIILFTALLADVIILPALIIALGRLGLKVGWGATKGD